MSKLVNLAVALPVVLGISTVALNASASAAESTDCSVKAVGSVNTAGNSDSRFVLNKDGTVSASFKVSGTNCDEPVTLSIWQAPDAAKGQPYDQQKLDSHVSGNFTEGTHTLSVKLPNCYYQADLVRGTSPTGENGSAVYEKANMMGSLHGGSQKCVETTATTVTPTPDPTPTTPAAATAPTVLPNTGTGSDIFLSAIVAGIVGTAFQYARRLRAIRSNA